MNRAGLDKRLQELGIYSEYYYRKELKSLVQMIGEGEQLNCILTGVNDGNRKMLAITDKRLFIISTLLGSGEFKVIKGSAVRDYGFTKKFLFSSCVIKTSEEEFLFKNTQASVEDLFKDAMEKLAKD